LSKPSLQELYMSGSAGDVARRLACHAEAVCRHYLSNGRREGRTWRVGDVHNTPGSSLSVRLTGPGSGPGVAGHWTDFATGEHGDLLDVIARTRRLETFRDVLEEARRFLSLPPSEPTDVRSGPPAPSGTPEAGRRLFASAKPIRGTLAESYLHNRGIGRMLDVPALRFHPRCFHRPYHGAPCEAWPALLAAVTDVRGFITGVQRTWLARDGSAKAPLATPRRAMGRLAGNGVRFGRATEVMAAGEGIETMLSLRTVLPDLPMVAALSATHLTALVLPSGLRRLYVVQDNDRAGERAAQALGVRARADDIEVIALKPQADDFNADLCRLGRQALMASLGVQLAPDDVARILGVEHRPDRTRRQQSLPSGPSAPPAAPGLQWGDWARSG
jgi:hypothetical protein